MVTAVGSSKRVLPHNLDAEASVLGGVLLRNEVLSLLDKLEQDDFYDPRHQAIFSAMEVLENGSRPIDEVTLEAQLQQMGKLEAVGGLAYLSQLALRVPTTENVVHYASIVRELHAARRLMLAASEITARGYEEYGDVEDYLDEAEAKIFEVTQRTQRGNAEHVKNLLKQVFGSLDQRFKAAGGITGVPSGFRDLDEKTAGFQPTELTILAARPAMGKTSFALTIARNCAAAHGFPVLVFSLEMSSQQLAERLLCSEAKVDSTALRRGQLQRQDLTNMTYAADTLSKAPIVIDDTPALSLRELRASARRFMADKELRQDKAFGLIIIDYLQLMQGRRDRSTSREQEISRDLARAQVPGQGAELPGHRPVAAQPQPRVAPRQAAAAVGSARVGRHRAGRRPHPLHLPRRGLQQGDRGEERRRGHPGQKPARPHRHHQDLLRGPLHSVRQPGAAR